MKFRIKIVTNNGRSLIRFFSKKWKKSEMIVTCEVKFLRLEFSVENYRARTGNMLKNGSETLCRPNMGGSFDRAEVEWREDEQGD